MDILTNSGLEWASYFEIVISRQYFFCILIILSSWVDLCGEAYIRLQ